MSGGDPDDGSYRLIPVVVMGVSGSGKTMIGERLAQRLDVPFEEGDDLHPQSNIAKMRAGIPLDDEDRAPWLDAVARWIGGQECRGGVVSCSALKRAYRDRLRLADANLRFVFLSVDRATLLARLQRREKHFIPASLLDSQLNTLERPGPAEPNILVVDGTAQVAAIEDQTLAWLKRDLAPADQS